MTHKTKCPLPPLRCPSQGCVEQEDGRQIALVRDDDLHASAPNSTAAFVIPGALRPRTAKTSAMFRRVVTRLAALAAAERGEAIMQGNQLKVPAAFFVHEPRLKTRSQLARQFCNHRQPVRKAYATLAFRAASAVCTCDMSLQFTSQLRRSTSPCGPQSETALAIHPFSAIFSAPHGFRDTCSSQAALPIFRSEVRQEPDLRRRGGSRKIGQSLTHR